MSGLNIGHPSSLDSVTHIIDVALTPVFLLSGIGALLNVFSSRLGRVADRVDQIAQALETASPEDSLRLSVQLSFQRKRTLVLDVAVVLGALGGGATSGATLLLFLGALRNNTAASALFVLFGLAIVFTIGALAAFVVEMLLASRGLRASVSESCLRAEQCAAEQESQGR